MNRSTFGDAVVTSHELASQAGLETIAAGGNAIDAAIAANAVLGVVAPETCGIGGDLFALVHLPGTRVPLALNASGWSGSNVTTSHLGGTDIPLDDPAAVTVPGCVAGWAELHGLLGSLSMETILGPALRYANDGFPVSAELAASLARRREELAPQAAAQSLYPNGEPPIEGQQINRSRLAEILGRIATDGPSAFYEGAVAKDIHRAVNGGITLDDLSSYEAEWVSPLAVEVFGKTAWTIPPNSQGYLTLAAARIFEMCGPPTDPNDPEYAHLAIEAYRSVAASRDELLSDPETAADTEALIGESMLTSRAAGIDRNRAGVWPQPRPVLGGTTYLAAIDRQGTAISLIQSNFHGIGGGIGAGDSGFFLHNRGAGFTLEPGHRNALAPRRRPAHTLAPTIWTTGNRLALILGTRGGHQQPQLLLQMAAHLFHGEMTPASAQEQPRWITRTFGPNSPSEVLVESRWDRDSRSELINRGHVVAAGSGYEGGWGPVSAITVDATNLRVAASDPRVTVSQAAVR